MLIGISLLVTYVTGVVLAAAFASVAKPDNIANDEDYAVVSGIISLLWPGVVILAILALPVFIGWRFGHNYRKG